MITRTNSPLADALRPRSLDEVFGQDHLLDENSHVRCMFKSSHFSNLILWGPPGSGKTTLARIIAKESKLHFESVSAVTTGIPEIKKLFTFARQRKELGIGTILLVDEIHRFNRAQQDAFLPHMEDGTIILIGATTENPSFELNSALLSRCKVLVLNRLSHAALEKILDRAEELQGRRLPLSVDAKPLLFDFSDGDGRYLLNMYEELAQLKATESISKDSLIKFLQKRSPIYDKSRDEHYNLISALHKSLRGSDCDAALYWLCRMLAGGEDPAYILRRLIRFAVEDVGLADPAAVQQALAAKQIYTMLGSPEGELAIVQAVIYLATAPKSNSAYMAHLSVLRDVKKYGSLMPPKHILNAPTEFMGECGYGKGYVYDHDAKDGFSGQNYFPEGMQRAEYYKPIERGFEREIKKRLEYWAKLRKDKADL